MRPFRKRKTTWQRVSEAVLQAVRHRGQARKRAMGVVGGVIGLTAASAAASSLRDDDR